MDDMVSKQVVIDTVHKIILGFFSDEDGAMTDTEKTLLSVNKAICDGVRALPSAQPQRTGRWELIDDTEFRIPGYRCSVCHCECEDWDKKPTYRFCPNCGSFNGGENEV